MSKAKKIWLGIGLTLLALFITAYIVLSILYPTETKTYSDIVIDCVFNKPLPVIGVSAAVLGFFVYKVVKVVLANKGKNYNQLKGEIGSLKQQLAQAQEQAEHYKELAEKLNNETNEVIKEVCDAIPNKKIKAIGEKYYGKETNSDTETKEI